MKLSRSRLAQAFMVGLLLCVAPSVVEATPRLQASSGQPLLFGRPMERAGFHFSIGAGWGGGPTSNGILHTLEVGGTFANGWTLGYNHVFIAREALFGASGRADLFGGHLLLLKVPLYFAELEGKIAVGLGEVVDLGDGFRPHFGVGWLYGVDLNLPLTYGSGLTLGVFGIHAATPARGHHVGFGVSLGYSWF